MRHSVLWGPLPKKAKPRGRPPLPPKPPVVGCCEFCKSPFTRSGRTDRPRRTCSIVCANGLRKSKKTKRAYERFKAARAARFLSFPKEAIVDG